MATVSLSLQIHTGAERIAAAFGYTSGNVKTFLEQAVTDILLGTCASYEAVAAAEAARTGTLATVYQEVSIG